MIDPKKMGKKEESDLKEKITNPTRRDFVKGMAIGAGALALSPLLRSRAEAIDYDNFAIKQALRGEKVGAGRVSHDYRLCVGCRVCEMTCAYYNQKEINPFKSRIKIYTYQPEVWVGVVCTQCGDRPCMNACPVEPDKDGRRALYEDPKGKGLAVDRDRCIQCGQCVGACAAQRNSSLRMTEENYPDGCTLCGGDPQCVKKCPQAALSILPRTTDGKYAAKPADIMAAEAIETLYGGPKTIVDNWK
ncbi:MAG: twin-arginine translocation signal domain-containing protein [Deltaproteobacteria bacterium]|nr:MAG: twin-arginine translocation signal domain-containing protein [Deltaproteobacteria bacterium]